MARKPRLHYQGALYHTMIRGNAKQDIFFNDGDRLRFCLFLQEAIEKYHCQIHAFCLMHNHAHLIIQVSNIPLSCIMQNISFRYARWINTRTKRVGHLFQGRFKAILVDTDSYLTTLIRYIHLNPVRANLIPNIHATWWSSHRDYLGDTIYPWLTTEFVLSHFSSSKKEAMKIYKNLMCAEITEQDKIKLKTGIFDQQILGDKTFATKVLQATHTSVPLRYSMNTHDVIDLVCGHLNVSKKNLCGKSSARKYSEPRAIIAWLCKELNIATLTETSSLFQKTVSTITEKIKWIMAEKPEVLYDFLKYLENRKTEA